MVTFISWLIGFVVTLTVIVLTDPPLWACVIIGFSVTWAAMSIGEELFGEGH